LEIGAISGSSPAGARAGATAQPLSPLDRLAMLQAARRDRRLKPAEVLLLIDLANYYNQGTGVARPSQETLRGPEEPGQPRSTQSRVSHGLKALEAAGYIAIERYSYRVGNAILQGRQYRLIYPPRTPLVVVPDMPVPACAPPTDMPVPACEERIDMPEPACEDMPAPACRTRDPEQETGKGATPPASVRGKTAPHLLPEDFAPSEQMITDTMAKHGFTRSEVEANHEEFVAWAINDKIKQRSWKQAWLNSQGRAAEKAKRTASIVGRPRTVTRGSNGGPTEPLMDVEAWGYGDH